MARHPWLRRWAALALGLALAGPALTGCASGGPGNQVAGGSSPSTGTDPVPTATAPTTPASGGGSGNEENPGDMTDPTLPGVPRTLRGTPAAGVEANCVLLTADDGQSYLLIGGDRQLITSGARIEVTGQVQPDLMTTCQQGTPFTVTTVRKI